MLINLLNLCRIRRKFPLPRTIWDGEETSYCFKEKSRQVSCCRGLSRVLFWLVVNWDPSCVQPRHASYAMFGNLWQCTVLEEGTINFFVLSRKKFSAPTYQICFWTNHSKFHSADLQLLLLSSNQNTVVHRKWKSNVAFTLSHFKKIVGWF